MTVSAEPLPIDASLLGGLETAMSSDEKRHVTDLLTSGEPANLAQAACIMSLIGVLLGRGVIPPGHFFDSTFTPKRFHENSYTNEVAVRKALLRGQYGKVKEIRQQEAQVNNMKRLYPIPNRMPRFVTIATFDPDGVSVTRDIRKPLTLMKILPKPSLAFANNEWDGTVADAFSSIKVEKSVYLLSRILGQHRIKPVIVTMKTKNDNIERILSSGWGEGYDMKISKPRNRVIICDSANDAARYGLRQGDVISHVNGNQFQGTAEDLKILMKKLHKNGQKTLNIVVNAEECVAEALALRSVC